MKWPITIYLVEDLSYELEIDLEKSHVKKDKLTKEGLEILNKITNYILRNGFLEYNKNDVALFSPYNIKRITYPLQLFEIVKDESHNE